jgi:hypothetical protein
MKISFGWSLAACNWVFCIAWPLAGCNLHPAGSRLNEICIRMAANRMKFASGWQLTELNLHPASSQLDANFAKIRS